MKQGARWLEVGAGGQPRAPGGWRYLDVGVEGEARGLARRLGELCALAAAASSSPALPGRTALSFRGRSFSDLPGLFREPAPLPQQVVGLLSHTLEGLHPWGT